MNTPAVRQIVGNQSKAETWLNLMAPTRSKAARFLLSCVIYFAFSLGSFAIGETCTGSDPSCPGGEYCQFPMGECLCDYWQVECYYGDPEGTCVPIPENCSMEYAPVCGCDTVTYSNACMAAKAGVSVLHPYECQQCGGWGGDSCVGADLVCKYRFGCAFDNDGVCLLPPTGCPPDYDPVCDCDGVTTYNTECEADLVQAWIAYSGECRSPCGDSLGECPEGGFCRHGCSSSSGLCYEMPVTCPDTCDPVCGCDWNYYTNYCHAITAGENILSEDVYCRFDLIYGVVFTGPAQMGWVVNSSAVSYNVYRKIVESTPPTDYGTCVLSGIALPSFRLSAAPAAGELWLLQVTGVFADGEGPMGIDSGPGCTYRTPTEPCL
jgi:hypothetical protein